MTPAFRTYSKAFPDYRNPTTWKRTKANNKCPICGKYGWCEVSSDGALCHCMHQAGEYELKSRQGGWLHRLYSTGANALPIDLTGLAKNPNWSANSLPTPAAETEAEDPAPAQAQARLTPERVSEVFTALIKNFPLTTQDKQYLLAEGLDPVAVDRCGSFRLEGSDLVAARLVKQFGPGVADLHQAFKKEVKAGRTTYKIAAWSNGILYPAYNEFTRLTAGVQLRKPDPPVQPGQPPKKTPNKYVWVSAGNNGVPLAVFAAKAGSVGGGLIITEGYKKAGAARRHFGFAVISVAGVSAYHPAELLAALHQSGAKKILLAFDQDKRQKDQVQKAEARLIEILQQSGATVEILEWSADAGNGLDQAIKAGAAFKEVAPPPPPLGPLDSPFQLNPSVVTAAITERYLPEIELTHRANLIRSGKNTGKTEQISRLIKKTLDAGGRVLSIAHRITLQQEASKRHGLAFYLDYKTGGPLADKGKKHGISNQPGLAIVVDSLLDLDTRILKDVDLLVIDEVEQVLAHLAGETVRPKRQQIQAVFEFYIKNSQRVVCLDADLSAITYHYMTQLIPPAEIGVTVNDFKASEKTFIAYELRADLKHQVLTDLRAGRRCYIATNSKDGATKLFKAIETELPALKGLLVTSRTAAKDGMHEKIQKINDTVQEYDYLVASPTLGTGVDIKVKHFDEVYLFGESGVNTHSDLLQQAGRVRYPNAERVHCWISQHTRKKPTEPEKLKQYELLKMEETALQIGLDPVSGERYLKKDPDEERFLTLWLDLRGFRNFSFNRLRDLFYYQAEKEGNRVVQAESYSAEDLAPTVEAYQAASDAVEQDRIDGIVAARNISESEFEKLKDSRTLTEEQEYSLARYQIEHFYGQEVSPNLVRLDDKGKTQARVINFIAATDPDYARHRDRYEASRRLEWNESNDQRVPRNMIYAPDLGHHTLKALMRLDILTWAGLRQSQDRDLITNFDPLTVRSLRSNDFCKNVYQHREKIERVLGITVKTNLGEKPTEFLMVVLRQLGIKCVAQKKTTGRQVKNSAGKMVSERVWEYTIDPASLTLMKDLAEAHTSAVADQRPAITSGYQTSALDGADQVEFMDPWSEPDFDFGDNEEDY